MKWAEELGYIDRSPLTHLKKPAAGRKEQVVSAAQYQALLDRTADQEFKDLLSVTWETGCRPQESLRVEARHVDLIGNRWMFPASESKNKRTPRVVYMTPKAMEITRVVSERLRSGSTERGMVRTGTLRSPEWAAAARDAHKRSTPFRMSLHQGDVGHRSNFVYVAVSNRHFCVLTL
jgi:integrase